MNWDDMRAAFADAKRTVDQADSIADDMARMLVGRLRKVGSDYTLKKLKRELAAYDAHTKRWKESR